MRGSSNGRRSKAANAIEPAPLSTSEVREIPRLPWDAEDDEAPTTIRDAATFLGMVNAHHRSLQRPTPEPDEAELSPPSSSEALASEALSLEAFPSEPGGDDGSSSLPEAALAGDSSLEADSVADAPADSQDDSLPDVAEGAPRRRGLRLLEWFVPILCMVGAVFVGWWVGAMYGSRLLTGRLSDSLVSASDVLFPSGADDRKKERVRGPDYQPAGDDTYLIVASPIADGVVYINGARAGLSGGRFSVPCSLFHVQLGSRDGSRWHTPAIPMRVPCKSTRSVVLEAVHGDPWRRPAAAK